MLSILRRGGLLALLAAASLCSLVIGVAGWPEPAAAQGASVDTLIARIYTEPNPQPFTMSADFTSVVILRVPTGQYVVKAVGTLVESRSATGEPKKRKADITKLEIPLLLRPFNNAIRKVVADLIEVEQKPNEFLPHQDVFIAEEQSNGRFLMGGVRTDIVTEVMLKYGQRANLKDPQARRAIAKWLWAPSQRDSIVRTGPGPYMFTAVVDEGGLMHELTLNYDWGHLSNRISFVYLSGRPFWKEVVSNSSSEVKGIGRVDGTMTLQVTNHCLNCSPR